MNVEMAVANSLLIKALQKQSLSFKTEYTAQVVCLYLTKDEAIALAKAVTVAGSEEDVEDMTHEDIHRRVVAFQMFCFGFAAGSFAMRIFLT